MPYWKKQTKKATQYNIISCSQPMLPTTLTNRNSNRACTPPNIPFYIWTYRLNTNSSSVCTHSYKHICLWITKTSTNFSVFVIVIQKPNIKAINYSTHLTYAFFETDFGVFILAKTEKKKTSLRTRFHFFCYAFLF